MKFLIVSLRYLGDCLLAAALAPALKARFPDAQIDMLTFKDNAPILEGVQDISHVIALKSSKAPTNYFTPNILRKSWSRLVVSVVHLDALAFPVAAT